MMEFRIATVQDKEHIAVLHAQSWRETYQGLLPEDFLANEVLLNRQAVWTERFAQPKANQLIIVAERNQQLCAFVCAYGNEDEKWGTFIDNLHVKGDCKGQGIGKLLTAKVVQWSKQHYPDNGMYLEVLADNHAARQFYHKLGATNQGSNYWQPPQGEPVKEYLYCWTTFADFVGIS